jgi:dihydroflavonol-4-reductase
MRVFVTGGTGFIGSRVVRALCERGDDVACLIRPTSRLARLEGLPVSWVEGEIRDRASYAATLRRCDACIHLAGPSSWAAVSRPDVADIVVGGAANIVEEAQTVPGLRLVHVSSAAAVGGSEHPRVFDEASEFPLAQSGLAYAIAKYRAETRVLEATRSGLNGIVVNPVETFGPDDDDLVTAQSILDLLQDWPIFVVPGGTSIAHVDDVARGIVLALDRGRIGERYVLGGENLTLEQIARLTLSLAGRHKPVLCVPRSWLHLTVSAASAIGVSPPIPAGTAGYVCRYWYMDSTKAKRELDWQSRSARETLRPVVEWLLRSQSSGPRGITPSCPADPAGNNTRACGRL